MDDETDIHDRLEQLEATVADQQATIEQLTETPAVGRRSVVASLLGAGAVGGLAGYGSQRSRAQASGPAGQVGTGEEPVDGFLWNLDVQNGATFNGSDVTGVGALEADTSNTANAATVATLPNTQTLSATDTTVLELTTNNDGFDQLGGFDNQTHKFVAPEDGTYRVAVKAEPRTDVTEFRYSPMKTGTEIDRVSFGSVSSFLPQPTSVFEVELNQGDEISHSIFIDLESSEGDIFGDGSRRTSMTIRRV